jgi:hypothetical protein
MISIQREEGLIVVGVFGELTLADYRRFEQEVAEQLHQAGRVDLLVDLRDMLDYTLDVVWEDIKFTRSHSHDAGRIALLSDAQWVAWSAWLSQLLSSIQKSACSTTKLSARVARRFRTSKYF